MKKLVELSMMCFVALSLCVLSCNPINHDDVKGVDIEDTGSYVDLELTSGTKWKSLNEIKSDDAKYDLFTFDEAVSEFGSNLPTKDDWEELKTECVWTWNGSGYKVTGDNGNTILLPASGYRNCYGRFIYEGSGGFFWSSTPNGLTYAWRLDFDSAYIRLHIGGCCNKGSVRLVQK